MISGGINLGIFTDEDDEEDELFDLYMLNEIHQSSFKGGNTKGNSSGTVGGCLTCLLLMMAIPTSIMLALVSVL